MSAGAAMAARRPVIGITTSINDEGDRQGVPVAYAEAVSAGGGTPIFLPMLAEAEAAGPTFTALCGLFDGLVIVGGGVISRNMVGGQPDDLEDTPPIRDSTDAAFLRHALAAGKPVLGVCYGMQFINAELGGSITADWQAYNGGGDEFRHSPKRGVSEHPLSKVAPGSIVAKVLQSGSREHEQRTRSSIDGTTAGAMVNSYHLQVIGKDMLAPGLTLTAETADGAVEAFEGRGGQLHGVQWHPEKMMAEGHPTTPMRGIFEDLASRATTYRLSAADSEAVGAVTVGGGGQVKL
jgi:putative glutamine amidotransferase